MIKLYTIQELLTENSIGLGSLDHKSFSLVSEYIDFNNEYSTKFVYDPEDWYEAVHTFLLLVCEAEGF